jgi:hypothetical protein
VPYPGWPTTHRQAKESASGGREPVRTPSPKGRRCGPWKVLPRGLGGAVPAALGLGAGHGCATPGSAGALLIARPAGGCSGARARRTASCSRHRIPAALGRAHPLGQGSRPREEGAAPAVLGAGRGWRERWGAAWRCFQNQALPEPAFPPPSPLRVWVAVGGEEGENVPCPAMGSKGWGKAEPLACRCPGVSAPFSPHPRRGLDSGHPLGARQLSRRGGAGRRLEEGV